MEQPGARALTKGETNEEGTRRGPPLASANPELSAQSTDQAVVPATLPDFSASAAWAAASSAIGTR